MYEKLNCPENVTMKKNLNIISYFPLF